MDKVSDERLAVLTREMFWDGSYRPTEKYLMATELLALRTAAEGMEKALERYFNALSDDCGDHCSRNCRECQARAALAEYRKVKNG